MTGPPDLRYADRELSWISFNERVLQEAADPNVPLYERLAFLAIFSSNLDEFFRVRVASLRSLLRLKRKKLAGLDFNPRRLLRMIHERVDAQQERFGEIFRGSILPALAESGTVLVNERTISQAFVSSLERYFETEVRPRIEARPLRPEDPPFLEDRRIYLVVEVWPLAEHELTGRPSYWLVPIPSDLPRFLALPHADEPNEVMFLDDVIRYGLDRIFPDTDIGGAYAVKLSRDAELYLDDEFTGDVVAAIRKSLTKRRTGVPSRFLYDMQSPYALVAYLQRCLELEDEDLIRGGRYHNLHDFRSFPRLERPDLIYPPEPPLPHPTLTPASSVLDAVERADRIIHFPYQSYDPVVRFLDEAASAPDVEEIWTTLYRVSGDSSVVRALIRAARTGKRVRAFVEVKARFDEASNLEWGRRMEEAGVQTIYSFPDLKVHAKMALVVRHPRSGARMLAYLATGNFNESTARVYADHGLFTADPRLTRDVRQVFAFLAGEVEEPAASHLLVAPFDMREGFYRRIAREVENARNGRPAGMVLKMNSLEDTEIIDRLYDASQAGVPVRLIVRGICRLVPGVPGQSERIRVTSIVDRYLEHARVYVFRNGGDEEYFLSSADWMHRNLSRRVEIAFPVYDAEGRAELGDLLDVQLADTVKARVIDARMSNRRVERQRGRGVRAQMRTREILERRSGTGVPFSSAGDPNGARA